VSSLNLIALGTPDSNIVEDLRFALQATFRFPVRLRTNSFAVDSFYNAERGQYNSTFILEYLNRLLIDKLHLTLPRERILAVLPHDLFIPILTYVFGEAELNGRVAVVSYHRLQNELYGLRPNKRLLSARLLAEAIHEIGHTFGLLHCHSQQCVMRSSGSVEEIDLKGSSFCRACQTGLERAMVPD